MNDPQVVLIRGGGDLASGVALRLHRVGMQVVITELPQPLVIRRTVSFAEAVFSQTAQVEEVTGHLVDSVDGILSKWEAGILPVMVDPNCTIIPEFNLSGTQISTLVDARMTKKPPYLSLGSAPLMIGLGPGFEAEKNCDAVVETNRGHYLGRVIWKGSAQPDTGVPEGFGEKYRNRVLYSPGEGLLRSDRQIGDRVDTGDLIGEVDGLEIRAAFKGVLRGLLHPGMQVYKGMKIGDIDPRDNPEFCKFVSDKALAVGGGVLEAILSISRTS